MRLLSTSPKIEKSNKAGLGYLSTILYLAPHKQSGLYNVCPEASNGCINTCLYFSGMGGVFPSIHISRIERTKLFFENRPAFLAQLHTEIQAFIRKAEKADLKPVVRLDGTSDQMWHKIDPTLYSAYPEVLHYGYTKVRSKYNDYLAGKLPKNLHLTFSRSENNEEYCKEVLKNNGTVSVIFRYKEFPETWNGYPVISGDITDLRHLDPSGHVIALAAKGSKAKRDKTSGFIIWNEPAKKFRKKSSKKLVLI